MYVYIYIHTYYRHDFLFNHENKFVNEYLTKITLLKTIQKTVTEDTVVIGSDLEGIIY